MILVLNEPHETGCFYFKFKQHYLQACTTSGKKILIFFAEHAMENYRGSTPEEMPHGVVGYLYWWHFEWCSWISICFHWNQTIDRSRLVWDLVECTGRVMQILNLELPINLWWCVFGQCIVQEPVNASEKHQSPWKLGTHSKCFWLCFFLFFFFPSSWSSCHPTCRVFWIFCCLQPFSKSSDIKFIHEENMRESEIYEIMWSHEDEILTIDSLWCRSNKLNAMWCHVVSVVFIGHCLPIHCLILWCHPGEISNKPYEMCSSN